MLRHIFGRWWIIGWYLTKITPIKHPLLKGGVAGQSYTITNHITTTGGREDDRSFKVKVKER
jgi:hypothetical protein